MSVIEVNHLTKFYGKARGIVDVSFQVNEGEMLGFIGPNGAGKSTTIRLLLSLIHPTSGSATIFGKDCQKQGPRLRQEIGYLPSEVFYYERMKVIDLLRYSASFYPGDHTRRMRELAELMELELNRRIEDLSYGNRKKVGIVQGLLHQPKLLLLDEPTAGLDPLMQRKFFQLIREENQRGVTVFFSSHILGEVQRLCNRVAIIKEGRIIEIADIRTLQQNNYKKVRVTADGLDAARFNIPGVTNLDANNGAVSFFYKGDINTVTRKIGEMTVADVAIEEPTLEEIFMHYYEQVMTMRANIYQHEFKMRLRSVITWSVAVAAVLLVYTSLFSSFARNAELLNQAMTRFPEALRSAFGMNGIDLSTVLGYFSFAFLFVQICLAIQAANYGFSLVSVEEREWTADFLLAKPVGRAQILTSKFLAALTSLTITNAVIWISSFAVISLFRGDKTFEVTPLLLLLLSIVLFQLFFLSVGLVVSLLVKRIRSVTPYAMGLGFGMYVLSAFGDMLGESVLEKLTPFKHFEPKYIVQHGAWDLPLVLISVAVIVVAVVGSYVLYTRRDIPSVV